MCVPNRRQECMVGKGGEFRVAKTSCDETAAFSDDRCYSCKAQLLCKSAFLYKAGSSHRLCRLQESSRFAVSSARASCTVGAHRVNVDRHTPFRPSQTCPPTPRQGCLFHTSPHPGEVVSSSVQPAILQPDYLKDPDWDQMRKLLPDSVGRLHLRRGSTFQRRVSLSPALAPSPLTPPHLLSNINSLLARVHACQRLTDLGTSPLDAFSDYGDSC